MRRFAFLVILVTFLGLLLAGCKSQSPVDTTVPTGPELTESSMDWTLTHSQVREPPARSVSKSTRRAVVSAADIVMQGNEFSVASAGGWPNPMGNHFHSDDPLTPPAVSADDLEVGSYFGFEECRGMSEFNLAGLPTASDATLEVEVVLLGGLYGQIFSTFDAEVFSYDANNLEEISDYGLVNTFSLGTFSTGGLSLGDVLSFDVTAAYNDAINRGVMALGVRLQPITDPGSGAVVLANSLLLLTTNQPPDCSTAIASIDKLWPPNHKMVDVDILGVVDPDGEPVSITISGITQDEPLNDAGDGNTMPDGAGVGTSTASVRAERSGLGNGRVYVIWFVASDGVGGECTGSVSVCVPHDKKDTCVDDGQLYDSTATMPMGTKRLDPLLN